VTAARPSLFCAQGTTPTFLAVLRDEDMAAHLLDKGASNQADSLVSASEGGGFLRAKRRGCLQTLMWW
jgi:hypothetical protein